MLKFMRKETTRFGMGKVRNALMMAAAVLAIGASTLPAGAQIRLMPLGDSLTSSINGTASYRYWLWKKIDSKGYDVDFVGSQWGVGNGVSGEPGDFDQHHEGHPGATTDDILIGLGSWAASAQPDVVLLLIGGNDLEQGQSPSYALANTRQIISTLRAVNPNVVILWATIPPASDHNKAAKAYNSGLVNAARKWSTKQSPIRVVNLWSGLSVRDTLDGSHPNTSGEKKYANRFFASLAPVLNRLQQR